jgi:large subunit ribosomal protein L28
MARKCQISGVSRQCGHRVSHAKNRTNHVFKANIQHKRVYVPEEGRFVTLKISTRMIRTIDRLGLKETLRKHGLTLQDVT